MSEVIVMFLSIICAMAVFSQLVKRFEKPHVEPFARPLTFGDKNHVKNIF